MDNPLPSTIQEAEALVLALYQPAHPETIARIQDTLHRMQRAPSGWWIARDLLGHADDKVKFFGALTLIVKLNTESPSLSSGDALELRQNLVGWFVKSLDDGSGAMVIRKLSSALVTFFLCFPAQWEFCIRHLCCSLSEGSALPQERVEGSIDMSYVLETLHSRKLQAALWFSGSLVDEAAKIEMNSAKHMGLYETLTRNVPDVLALMSHGFSRQVPVDSTSHDTQKDSITCLQSWIWFSQRMSTHSDELIGSLRVLIQPTIASLAKDELYEPAVELLSDILSNYSGFLTEDHYESLFSLFETQWSRERYQRLIGGDFDFDSVQFGQLMIALGDSKVEALIHGVDGRSSRFLGHLRGLLSAQGYPVSDDKIFVPALEFWSTYVETLTDSIYSEDEDSKTWVPTATSHVLEAVSTVWQRIAYPPPSVIASWDSAERAGFGDARKDVADLLQSTFTVTGPSLISTFGNLTLQSVSSNSWSNLEAAAFCLGSLADCVTGDPRCDKTLSALFSSPLFNILQTSSDSIPGRTRQTCISLIEKYADYFERETQSLPAALNLLFSVLADPVLAGPAARSIQRLCFSSRTILASEVSAFLSQYQTIATQSQLDCLACERIMGAIAAVIQAVQDGNSKFDHLEALLSFVQHDARKSVQLLSLPRLPPDATAGSLDIHRCSTLTEPSELPLHMALKALRCLISIGKGFQVPGDVPCDLEKEKDFSPTNQDSRLDQLQSGILSLVAQLQSSFPQSGEVAESICNIFRTGFSEYEGGPFVFPPRLVCDYLIQQTSQTPRIGLFVSTACSLLSSLRNVKRGAVDETRAKLLGWVIGLLQQLPEPDNDTELAQNGIEFTNRLTSREPAVLFHPDYLPLAEFFFMYALRVLDGREPLPKAAAADFWATFMTLKPTDQGVRETIDHAITQLGPLLARSIIRNIGGNASRSELDRLSEPLKKMVNHHAKARVWLEQALYDSSFPGQQLSDDEKALFVRKIINLRGSRGTNQVVRDFWLAARGSKFAYAS
ncbi:armadillo-type protein [Colletotrichum navitas]|uniref:Armadillo-type protein n=1 Tax=Colletotrichum navitas TaxID=681940 RepID=A0AAD8QA90_9PEZI|nr:armadillo-type protein [Colletotrichum navitas]KAK1598807.1 armadillo-type protein [Colletotrichum navitas]